MRISDWSSDVCSSDLSHPQYAKRAQHRERQDSSKTVETVKKCVRAPSPQQCEGKTGQENAPNHQHFWRNRRDHGHRGERQSVVAGTRETERESLGGRSSVQKKKTTHRKEKK